MITTPRRDRHTFGSNPSNNEILKSLWNQLELTCGSILGQIWTYQYSVQKILSYATLSNCKNKKLNTSAVYEAIIPISSVNLPLVFIFKWHFDTFRTNQKENVKNII